LRLVHLIYNYSKSNWNWGLSMDDTLLFIIPSLIILIASFIQGAVGFGFVLVSAPILSFFIPLKTLVPILIIFGLFINSMIVVSARKHIAIREIGILILMGIVGIPLGVYGLNTISPYNLKLIIGIIIIITAIAMLVGFKFQMKNKFFSYTIAGLLSGVLNGAISMSGPPIALFLTNEGYERDKFRANINTFFLITNVVTIIAFSLNGIMNYEVIHYAIINILFLMIGTFIGIKFSPKINEATFKKVILVLLIVTGIVTLFNNN